jgi:hypothetical protein
MLTAAALWVLAAASPARELERLYLELQFERCLERASALGALELDDPDRGELALYRGLCRYGLGDVTQAASDFDEAVRLAPAIEAPHGTSPKILTELEAARVRAQHSPVERPAPAPAAPPLVVEPAGPRLRPLFWSLGGVALVAAAVGMVLGTQAQAHANAANEARFAFDADGLARSARTFEVGTNVTWTLAAAAAVGALAVWIFDR